MLVGHRKSGSIGGFYGNGFGRTEAKVTSHDLLA